MLTFLSPETDFLSRLPLPIGSFGVTSYLLTGKVLHISHCIVTLIMSHRR